MVNPLKICVSLVAFRGLAPAEPLENVFDQGEVTIGRSLDNDFVVEDPDRVCSRNHAVLYVLNGDLFLEDTSSSFTVLNEQEKIGRGNKRRLQSGDRVGLGDAVLRVSFEEDKDPHLDLLNDPSSSSASAAFSIDDFFSAGIDSPSHPEISNNTVEPPKIPFTETGDVFQPGETSFEENIFDFSDLGELGASGGCSSSALVEPEHLIMGEVKAEVPLVQPPPVVESTSVPQMNARSMACESAVKAFFDGMDIQLSDIKDHDLVEVFGAAGMMMHTMTEGVMEMLKTRGDVKREFGMDTTQIAGVMNNPLKFSESADDALLKLLVGAEGYLGASQAIAEGVADAKAHQLAVMSGMQAALVALLKRFEPSELEKRLETRFVLSRKAKYWELYKESYEQLVGEAEDNFNALFGDEFSRIYIEQVRSLKH